MNKYHKHLTEASREGGLAYEFSNENLFMFDI